jgi:hypothetical protein
VIARVSRRVFGSRTLEASLWLTVPALVTSCGERHDQNPIASARAAGIDKPIFLAIVAGISAPNPHNTQAWRFRVHGDLEMSLYVDPERLLLRPLGPVQKLHPKVRIQRARANPRQAFFEPLHHQRRNPWAKSSTRSKAR